MNQVEHGEGIIAYDHASFIQFKSHEIVCNMEVTLFSRFDIGIDLNDPELVYCKSIKTIQQ